jgi:YVTN family beta-propeller protein
LPTPKIASAGFFLNAKNNGMCIMKSLLNLLARASFLALLVAPALAAPRVIATIPVGYFPNSIAVNPKTNMVYVANWFGNSVSVIDGSSNTVIATIPIASQAGAVIAYVPRNQIFVYGPGYLAVIDGNTNTITSAHTHFPSGVPAELGTGPLVYVADQNNNQVHVENLNTKQDVVDIPVTSPYSIAVNAVANLAYTCSAVYLSPDITVIDTTSNTVVNTFTLPFLLTVWVSADAANNLLYAVVIAGENSELVAVLDATNGNLLGSASTGTPAGFNTVLALPDKQAVADGGTFNQYGQNNQLFFINANTFKITSHLVVGANPVAMAYNPATKSIYVANTADNTVSVVGQ